MKKDKDKEIRKLKKEIRRLRGDCAEAYQAVGAVLLGDPAYCPPFMDDDVERLLDNLSAAANGDPRPHKDLLPFPRYLTIDDRINNDPAYCKQFLTEIGIINKLGNLSKEYSGEE